MTRAVGVDASLDPLAGFGHDCRFVTHLRTLSERFNLLYSPAGGSLPERVLSSGGNGDEIDFFFNLEKCAALVDNDVAAFAVDSCLDFVCRLAFFLDSVLNLTRVALFLCSRTVFWTAAGKSSIFTFVSAKIAVAKANVKRIVPVLIDVSLD